MFWVPWFYISKEKWDIVPPSQDSVLILGISIMNSAYPRVSPRIKNARRIHTCLRGNQDSLNKKWLPSKNHRKERMKLFGWFLTGDRSSQFYIGTAAPSLTFNRNSIQLCTLWGNDHINKNRILAQKDCKYRACFSMCICQLTEIEFPHPLLLFNANSI